MKARRPFLLPAGGLVYSNGLPTGDNKTLVQAVEWNMF